MKLAALPAVLVAVLLALVVVFAGGDAPGFACAPGVATDVVLATIRTVESGGNYQARAAGSTASGAYQFLDATWANYAGYPHAADAPTEVQDARAAIEVDVILAAHHGDVSAIAVVWYIGHVPGDGSAEWDMIPNPTGGNTLTPRQYQQHWLTTYDTLLQASAPPDTSAARSAPPTVTLAPGATVGTTESTALIGTCFAPIGGYALPLDRAIIDQRPDDLGRPHHDYPALDLPVPVGTRVYAVAAGTVTRTSNEPRTCYPDSTGCTDICGLGLTITDRTGITWIYCHASTLLVTAGQTIAAGQQILLSGNTGHSSGPHLHLGIRIDGIDHCPQTFLEDLLEPGRVIDPHILPTSGCTEGLIDDPGVAWVVGQRASEGPLRSVARRHERGPTIRHLPRNSSASS